MTGRRPVEGLRGSSCRKQSHCSVWNSPVWDHFVRTTLAAKPTLFESRLNGSEFYSVVAWSGRLWPCQRTHQDSLHFPGVSEHCLVLSFCSYQSGHLQRWCCNAFLDSPRDESGVLNAVQKVHAMIDKEIAAGTDPNNVFVCGFSQGGALTFASVLLYPKTLGGGAIFGGYIPFNTSIIERISPNAKRTPILWSHGMADGTVLFEAAQAGPTFLEQAGVSCEFKAYPNLGHSLSQEQLQYLESWIKTRMQSSA